MHRRDSVHVFNIVDKGLIKACLWISTTPRGKEGRLRASQIFLGGKRHSSGARGTGTTTTRAEGEAIVVPGLSYLGMQDASDILAGQVGKDTTRAGAEDPSPRVPERPAGISRELYSLLSDEALPSLIPSKAPGPTSFRDRKKGGVKWEWKPFSSSARKDKCQLKHWWKKHENPEDYSFARFNKKARLIAPTKNEYDQLLKDPNWTPQETAHLLKVAAKYALRWHVIFDRYYIESKDAKVSPRGGAHGRGLEAPLLQHDEGSQPAADALPVPRRRWGGDRAGRRAPRGRLRPRLRA
eukprot:COSAG05_NODE_1908_length_3845_cov_16.756670_1_plen_296_part_00